MTDLQRADRLDVTDALLAERAALLALLADLDHDQWSTRTECPAWTVHGIALHLLGDDLSLLSRQRDAATNGLLLYAETHPGLDFRGLLDGFNEGWVTAASFLSPELTIELLRLSGEWSHRFYSEIDPGALGEPVLFFGAQPAPYWQIAAREYLERWIHQQQIRRALGAADLGPGFLRAATAAVAHGLAAQLGAVPAREGTTAALSLRGLASWTLRRAEGRWEVWDGWSDAPDVEVELEVPEATRTLSSGLGPASAVLGQLMEGVRALAR